MRDDASTRPCFDADAVDAAWQALARRDPRARVIGVSGLQGSGKTTFARQLAAHAGRAGRPALVLSIDDFYFGRRDRARLARDVHPLFATRGVPGTHDIERLEAVLAALPRASGIAPVRWPRFDKGRDTRIPPSRWPCAREAPSLVVIEGWCVGVPPQDERALRDPVNSLERDEDPDGVWRRHANDRLAGTYARLWSSIDALVVLQAPEWNVVRDWRARQERPLLARGAARALDDTALDRFLMHFERLSRHAIATLPARGDVCIRLGADHAVLDVG